MVSSSYDHQTSLPLHNECLQALVVVVPRNRNKDWNPSLCLAPFKLLAGSSLETKAMTLSTRIFMISYSQSSSRKGICIGKFETS